MSHDVACMAAVFIGARLPEGGGDVVRCGQDKAGQLFPFFLYKKKQTIQCTVYNTTGQADTLEMGF